MQQNHSTQDSRVVPHRGTNWAALWLTLQIGRDAVLSESYGRGCCVCLLSSYKGDVEGLRLISHANCLRQKK